MQNTIAGILFTTIKVAIFDLDGTLVSSYMANPNKDFNTWTLLPNRLQVLQLLRSWGISICIASSQGGVAFGLISPAQVETKVAQVAEALNFATCVLSDGSIVKELDVLGMGVGHLDAFVAYDNPEATLPQYRGDARRKPNATMILEALCGLDCSEAIFVGDRPEDESAAAAAGIQFMWAEEFFAEWAE